MKPTRLLWSLLLPVAFSPGLARAAEDRPPQPDALPRVLILGDSISIGYTPFVQELLKGEAVVLRPMQGERQPENCEGTTRGVRELDRWLKISGGDWDVIHFNFGLHDMKRVDPQTGAASNNPDDPRQASPEQYQRQLREITGQLKETGARLVFATTTPVPPGGVRPHRDVEDPARYNEVARKVMREHGVEINDLYGFALPRLKEIQQPVNVHFTPEGSRLLAEQVVRRIRQALTSEEAAGGDFNAKVDALLEPAAGWPDGLYRHSPLDEAAWGRGNGFPALGLALALSDLSEDAPQHGEMLRAFRTHVAALLSHQDATGMWRQVIDHPGSYREHSATCMIAFAMLRGVRRGWLDEPTYRPAIERAWKAILARTAADGSLIDVCTGTGKQTSLRAYLDRPAILGRDARGGAMALLLAVEMARWETEN